MSDKRIYLDNNATTMVTQEVAREMEKFQTKFYGNPSSLHRYGLETLPDMRIALDKIYEAINASSEDDVIITSGAAEANNHVLKSLFFENLNSKKNHIVTTNVEHPTIYKTCEYLESRGANITYLAVDEKGLLDPKLVADAITGHTFLVSIMWANNEIGTILPVKKIAEICREKEILFHTDATQAIGKLEVDLQDTPADYLSFSAHKFHGPKGIGGLFMRYGKRLLPFIHGGEQMGNLRAGTLNVPGIIGMGKAIKEAVENLKLEQTEVKRLRDKLEDFVLKNIPDTILNGDKKNRTPNTINISFKGIEGEAMLWDLDQHGIAASTGSACSSEELEASPVLTALGMDKELAHTAIRFSLSRFTTEEEIDKVIEVLPGVVKRLRDISSGMILEK